MKIDLHSVGEITDAEWTAWENIARDNGAFDNPYFHPQFTRAVADVRSDVEIAVFREGVDPIGFFPFQRCGAIAKPIGGRLSDFHGAIISPEQDWTVKDLLSACNVRRFDFDHLIEQPQWSRYQWGTKPSTYLDLSEGFEAYCRARRDSGSKKIKQIGKLGRKLAREHGNWTVDFHSTDSAAWDALRQWKSEQYQQSGLVDLFQFDWVGRLLRRVLAVQTDEFAGVMSVLRIGDKILAVDLGMRSGTVLHSWFPSYDREFSRYGAGHVLSLETAREAAERGIARIDWGKGEEEYKTSFASGHTMVAEGSADLRPLTAYARRSVYRAAEWLKQSSLRDRLRKPVRAIRRAFGKSTFS